MIIAFRAPRNLAFDMWDKLRPFIEFDGRFRITNWGITQSWKGLPRKSTEPRQWLQFDKVFLTKAAPYCGNHPGPCAVPDAPRPISVRMGWDNWVAFHNLINDWFDSYLPDPVVDIWTKPNDFLDEGQVFIVRDHQLGRRVRFDWEQSSIKYRGEWRHDVLVWNHGTPDQFEGYQRRNAANRFAGPFPPIVVNPPAL